MEESVFNEWVAGLRAAIKEIKGDSKMTKKSAKWVFVPEAPGPPPPLVFIDKDHERRAVVHRGGFVRISATGRYRNSSYGDDIIVRAGDLRGLIASLQSILVLAEEHFGEEWGK